MRKNSLYIVLILCLLCAGCDSCDKYSPTAPGNTESVPDSGNPPPSEAIRGVELSSLKGWFAGIYPWEFLPDQSPVHPIPELFLPYQKQDPGQISYQEDLLNSAGSSADVLSFNTYGDLAHWSSAYFSVSSRPFFLLYEHISSSARNMSLKSEREAFESDIKYMLDNVIRPYRNRYVVVNGRAVIYMWATGGMTGDFGSLLIEMKAKYPVFFIGSSEDPSNVERFRSFDGFMDYALPGYGPSNYRVMSSGYLSNYTAMRNAVTRYKTDTGKTQILLATFQAAYDHNLVIPRRDPLSVYPATRQEMEDNAGQIRAAIAGKIFDGGPYVVWSELPEGGAVIPSIPRPESSGRFVGYGTARLDIVKKYFGR